MCLLSTKTSRKKYAFQDKKTVPVFWPENVTKKYTFSEFGFQLPEKNAESVLDLPICQGLGQEAATQVA